ncbi:ead/Ea22-like family protein [Klebsiella michiganensis]|uniref:ead/Ea22-like family protein n=1 Tax=Klebsiella michiganensis TaxID=1134687 RepID=UPI001D0E1BD9|nr:ead/Ea22-like family protein [Klebsiella michiganensis]
MTDITELAQSLKAAAEKATPGPWEVARDGKTLVSNQSHPIATVSDAMHRMLADGSTGQDAEFIALANPANIRALAETLEKSEKTSEARREAIDITHKRATRERDRANAAEEVLEKAQKSNEFLKGRLSELANFNPDWDKLEASYESWREIAAELLVAKDRISELESFRTAYMEWSDKTDWVRTDRRFDVVKPLGKHIADVLKAYIEHLESPTFTFEVTAEPFTCPRCGTTTTHPEGWHYCHKREDE